VNCGRLLFSIGKDEDTDEKAMARLLG